MFFFVDQANAILTKLAEIQGLNQIDIIEFVDNLENRPRTLPGVSLLPPGGKPQDAKNALITAENTWMVVIVAKTVLGPLGHLALMDSVLDTLSGFQPVAGVKPMVPVEWGLMNERIGEAAFASFVTFAVLQRAAIS